MATVPAIPLEAVQSSRVAEIGYDADSFTLAVRFPPTKAAPAGKVYHYGRISEEMFDDLKNAESIGRFFGEQIVKRPDLYPFVCVDDGTGAAPASPAESASASTSAEHLPKPEVYLPSVAVPEPVAIDDMPDDGDGLKERALTTRAEATAFTITTAEEYEQASREVVRIRAERKLAIEKVNRIKIPATQAWQAACALFNEVDSRYAEAENFLNGGILAYRRAERERVAAEQERRAKQQEAALAEARRQQEAEYARLQDEARQQAEAEAAALAEQDAKALEEQGAPAEVVEQIRANPLPVAARHVEPPPLAYVSAPPPIVQQNIPKVEELGFRTVWQYEIVDERQIPLSHEFYTLDRKKISRRVQDLKQHANIPGVRVWSEEKPVNRGARGR